MNDKHNRYTLYIITLVILATIGIQVFWNYKNYLTNKQQLINDVQVSLDKAVDDYYAALAEKTTVGFSFNNENQENVFEEKSELSKIFKSIDKQNKVFKNLDSLNTKKIENITVLRGINAGSMLNSNTNNSISIDSFNATIKNLKQKNDTTDFSDIKILTSKIVVSIKNDSLNIKEVDSLLKIEFNRKNLNLKHQLWYYTSKQSETINKTIKSHTTETKEDILNTISKSSFLPKGSVLKVYFKNETKTIFKRILSGILISTLLVLTVISCLFYLLKIINKQKQLAEVKNDLISNITHEFKTPITTINAAIESIKNFNVLENKEKTKKYLNLSTTQLSKLNIMVEKLLETATLDSENLSLNRDNIDIVSLISLLIEKHQIQTKNKTLTFNASAEKICTHVDSFHFENAINNILDNAVKYGGEVISVFINQKKQNTEIIIIDNGNTLTKQHAAQIFDKFYRVPKGNTHDIKGFGIGLYYTKKIIQKHDGNITVSVNNGTSFKITIPNER